MIKPQPPLIRRLADLGFALFLLVCLAVSVRSLGYHGERLKQHAITTYQHLVEVYTRQSIEHFAHTVGAVDVLLRSLLESGHSRRGAREWQLALDDALRHAPHLRSMALLDDSGRIVVSSHPDDVGLVPALDHYLPTVQADSDLLRIGPPFLGRNLVDGEEVTDWLTARPDIGFVPIVRSLSIGEGGRLSLVAVLNVDFFLNRMLQTDASVPLVFDVLRFDGRQLFSTLGGGRTAAHLARNQVIARLWQGGVESGVLGEDLDRDHLVAHRLDRTLPVGVVGWVDRDAATAAAVAESRRQQWALLPLVALALAVVLVAYLLFRRVGTRELKAQRSALSRHGQLLDALPAAILLFGADGRLVQSNEAWRTALGRKRDADAIDVVEFAEAFSREDEADAESDLVQGMLAVLNGRTPAFEAEYALDTPAGRRQCRVMVRRFAPQAYSGIAVLVLDITGQHQAQAEASLLRSAVSAAGEGFVVTDTNAHIEWVNPAFTELTGYTLDEAAGLRPQDLVSSGRQDRAFYERMWATIVAGQVWRGEVVNRRKDGSLYHEALTIAPVSDGRGHIRHFVAIKENISQRKELEEQLRQLATTDVLTGLSNRRAFMDGLARELQRHHRHGGALAVLMLDIDRFKSINDRLGHAAGDHVLLVIAEVLRDSVRSTDLLGRIGGEEFAIVSPATDVVGAGELAERIRLAVERAVIDFDGEPITVTISIGHAQVRGADHADGVLSRADTALYVAKHSGRNRSVGERDCVGGRA